MGCDYYVVTELQIEYKKKSENFRFKHVRLHSERHWFSALYHKYDSDDPKDVREQAEKEYKEECTRELEKHSKEMLLYENGKWLTDNQDNIKLYISKIRELSIIDYDSNKQYVKLQDIAKIFKVVYAYKA